MVRGRRAQAKWRLLYQGHTDAVDAGAALGVSRAEFARLIRERLPARTRSIEFEVDVAAQESRAFNPLNETSDILLYDPLEDRFQQSQVLDLFRRKRSSSGSYRRMSD